MGNEAINVPLHKSVFRILLGTAAILSIPLIAMRFSEDVDWKLPDFMIIGTLLISAGLLYQLIARQVRSKDKRFAIGLTVAAVVMYLWAELAVGVFTNWGS